jgi:hypothetical protein
MQVPIVKAQLVHISLFCSIVFGCLPAGWASQIDMPHHRHGPPWTGPVASSQMIHVGAASIQIDFVPGDLDLPKSDVIQWIETAARAVSEYYGKFPVARARVLVVPIANERGVLTGTTWGDVDGFPAFTRMRLGQHTTEQTLASDWTMTHEFVHTALPALSPDHHWLEEGLATYVEPIARVQIGTLSPEQLWGGMVHDIGKGEPQPGEDGLDNTHTWASTYWGGALFCLMADVSIREKTGNRKGLQDALRGIADSGGSIADGWPISKVLDVGDLATGTSVLADLYKKMGNASYAPVDLTSLWKQLGIHSDNGKIKFDDHAPLAPIRQTITSPR